MPEESSYTNLGNLQVSELDAISEAIEKDKLQSNNIHKISTHTQKGIRLTIIAVMALAILLITNFTIDTYQTYLSISLTSNIFALAYLGVYLLAFSALVFYILYTIRNYFTLKDAFSIQSQTATNEGYEAQKEIALKILIHYQAHQDLNIREKASILARNVETNSIHNPFEKIKSDIIDSLDKKANMLVYSSAKEISIFTAFSPGSALDSMAVIFSSLKLMKKIFYIYGYRTNLFTTLIIIRKILENASLAALIEYSDDSVNDVLGNTFLSTISIKIAEGMGNGVLMLRIGNILIQSARPFASDGSIATYKHMTKIFLQYIKNKVIKK